MQISHSLESEDTCNSQSTYLSPVIAAEVSSTSNVSRPSRSEMGDDPILIKYLRRGFECTPKALHSSFCDTQAPIRGATRSTYFTVTGTVGQNDSLGCTLYTEIQRILTSPVVFSSFWYCKHIIDHERVWQHDAILVLFFEICRKSSH